MTPWDRRVLSRSAALTCALLLLAVVLTAATDEGGLPWTERVSRVVPIVPLCSALATGLTLGGRDRRGEGRALEAIGRSPFANAFAAAAGAMAVGALAALAVLLHPSLHVSTFFPTVPAGGSFTYDAGAFTSSRGWRILADGSIALPDATAASGALARETGGLPTHARAWAALLTLLGTAAFGLTMATMKRQLQRPALAWGPPVVALVITAATSMVCLQAAAAGRVPVSVTPIPSTLLLLGAVWAIVRGQWQAAAAQGRVAR